MGQQRTCDVCGKAIGAGAGFSVQRTSYVRDVSDADADASTSTSDTCSTDCLAKLEGDKIAARFTAAGKKAALGTPAPEAALGTPAGGTTT